MSNRRYDLYPDAEQQSGADFLYLDDRQYLDGDFQTAIKGRLLYVSTSKFEGDWHSIPHNHAFSEMFYVTSGKGKFLAAQSETELKPDDFVIVNPHIQHTETSIDKNPLEYIVLGVEGISFNFDDSTPFSIASFSHNNLEMRTYLSALVREMENNKPHKNMLCQSLLSIIMISILRHKKLNISIVKSKKITPECASVKEYIDANFKENITLDELAQYSHLNKYYLVHNFTKSYDISPINYLLNKRITESKYLLTTTDYSLSQISQIVGFSSSSYFSQSFKRCESLSPQEYRKLNSQK